MTFLTVSLTYFLAVATLRPALMEREKVPQPSEEQIQRSFASLGLDPNKNSWERYIDWLFSVLFRWDWGRSPNGSFVNAEFADRVWISARLYLVAMVLTILVGVVLGVYTAARQYRWTDRVITGTSYFMYILPVPVGYFLIQLGAIAVNEWLGQRVFFVTGISTVGVEGGWAAFWDLGAHYIVPTFALVFFGWQGYQISQRQYLLDHITADFVRTARAKGLKRDQAIWRHALRVSSIPLAQSVAFSIPGIFTGAFFAEQIFAWPGLGVWSIEAIGNADVNAVVSVVAFGSLTFAVGAILADLATSLVDPRVLIS